MNHSYRLTWNESTQRYVPAPETAKGRGKASGRGAVVAAVGALAMLLGSASLAGPTGGAVSAGSGAIAQSGSSTTITQSSQNLAINWATFNVASGERVAFVQPNSSAIALNRVLGSSASSIDGVLTANGQVWVLNPNGVLFGTNAQVSVGGLVASTLSLSDADFMAGKYQFTGDGSQGSVVNQGSLTAGYVALIGKQVSNEGTITTAGGAAMLGAGDKITLSFSNDKLLAIQVDEGTLNALAQNKGLIRADNGTVILTASAKDALLNTVVNNEGVIEARGIDASGGTILLLGGFNGGTVKVAGTLDASANGSHAGGFIETSGAHVKVADGAAISTKSETGKTGTWLIDPTDFTIAASGGDITGATLGTQLASNNVTIESANGSTGTGGDIHVNDAVSWGADTTLTLNAANNINVNAAITATGTSAGLALNHGDYASTGSVASGTDYNIKAPITLSGANATLAINGESYTLIHSMSELDAIDSTGLSGKYALAQDLDASGSTYSSALVGDGSSGAFAGTFAGLGHTIGNLTISTSSNQYVGLFGQTATGSTIRDIGLVGGSVSSNDSYYYVGGLVGYNAGSIRNAYATGSVSSSSSDSRYVGGLVGYNAGSISNAYATGSVSGYAYVGGLAGWNDGSIDTAYATGSVSATYYGGGLVGVNYYGSIGNAYATGNASSNYYAGGLTGYNSGSISNSYWDSSSTGRSAATGVNYGGITNVSAVNNSSAYSHASYANLGTWSETAGGSGVWVANDGNGNTWALIEGSTRPFLYSEYSTTIRNAHQLQLMALDTRASYTLLGNIDASETSGSNASGMWTAAGLASVGNRNNAFTGTLDGQNHTVNNLNIARTTDDVGLIGYAEGATVRNIGLEGGSVSGGMYVGPLVGTMVGGSVTNAYSTATVSGSGDNVGGLVGLNSSGSVSNAYSTGPVTGSANNVGGLVGSNSSGGTISDAYSSSVVTGVNSVGGLAGESLGGSISNAYATGSVSGSGSSVGGLVGNNTGSISNGYATGSVSGVYYVGGLAGWNEGSIDTAHATGSVNSTYYAGGLVGVNYYNGGIRNAYATGSISGNYYLGGLVGINYYNASIDTAYATGGVSGSYAVGGLAGYDYHGSISNAYATGSASGAEYVGGLAGYTQASTISNTYSSGAVSGTSGPVGGLLGYVDGSTVTSSYWNTETSGQASSAGGTGLTSAQMMQASNFANWDISTSGGSSAVWRIYEGSTAPLLRSFMTAVTVTPTDVAGKTYDGSVASGGSAYTSSDSAASLQGTLSYASSSAAAGSYSSANGTLALSGLYSGQQGYDISYATTTLSIDAVAVEPPVTTPVTPTPTPTIVAAAPEVITPATTPAVDLNALINQRVATVRDPLQSTTPTPPQGDQLTAQGGALQLSIDGCGMRLPTGQGCVAQ